MSVMPCALLTRSAATTIAASALVLSGLNLSGAAASVAEPGQANGALPVWMAITSVSPDYARAGQTVTVSGTLTNISNSQVSGLSIQLRSSGQGFTSRGQMQEYANNGPGLGDPAGGAPPAVTKTLRPRP